ncbi:MAG: N-acetylmuramoyl-L-alanine amidase [Clostridiales bacterium]|nr:N-acetylmuramoyl-L-alanine amidase [Clostridiales bacterium]
MKTAQKVLLILVAVVLVGFCAVDFFLPDGILSALGGSESDSNDDTTVVAADASAGEAEADSSSEAEAEAEEVVTEVSISQYDLIVCVDAGHGGNDPGCITEDGREESADVLNLALLLKEKLEVYGVTVVMTRETDEYVSLADRCRIANNAGADLFVSIHRNILTTEPSACGVEAWIESHYSQEEYDLASNILEELQLAGIQKMRGVSSGTETSSTKNYYVNSATKMPATLLEMGFMSNEEDNELYDANLEAYAQAIADGLIATWVQYGGESVGEKTYSVSTVNSYINAQQAKEEEENAAAAYQLDGDWPINGTANDTVNLRSGPGTEYNRVSTIGVGSAVTVVGASTNDDDEIWYELTFQGSGDIVYQGYCLSNFIDLDETASESEEDEADEAEATQNEDGWPRDGTATTGVNLRSGPGTEYGRVTSIGKGDAVTVVDSSTNDSGEVWYKLTFQGTNGVTYEGYCLSNFIDLG